MRGLFAVVVAAGAVAAVGCSAPPPTAAPPASTVTVTNTVTVTAAPPKPTLTPEQAADADYIAALHEKGLDVGESQRAEMIQRGHMACIFLREDTDNTRSDAKAGMMHKYDIGAAQANAIVIAAMWVYCPALR